MSTTLVPNFIREKLGEDNSLFSTDETHLFIGRRFSLSTLFKDSLSGDFPSLGRVASLYFWGNQVEKNPEFALAILEWIISLKIEGSQKFEYAYARYLIHQHNFDTGIILLEALSEKGHGMAMTTLSYLYEQGRGVPVDKYSQKKLLLAGAKTGDPQSRSALMHYYFKKGGINLISGLFTGVRNTPAIIKLALSSDYNGRV